MTHLELRAILATYGLSQVGAAAAIGIAARTMRRYVSGTVPIPQWLPLALYGWHCQQVGMSNAA